MRPIDALLALLLTSVGLACARHEGAELLELEAVQTERLEEGRALVVRVEGVPADSTGRLSFDGHVARPGSSEEALHVQLPARATPGGVQVDLDRRALAALGGRGTFRGALRIALTGALDAPVTGQLDDVTLDIGYPRGELPGRADRTRARDRLAALGAVAADAPDPERGVVLDEVAGTLAQLGLAPSDRILEWNGVRVADAVELVPPPDDQPLRILFAREGHPRPFEAVVAPAAPPEPSGPFAWVALGLLLLFFALGPGARSFRRTHDGPRWRGADLLALVGALPLLCVPLDAAAVFVALLGLSLGLAWRAPDSGGRLATLRASGRALLRELPMLLVVFGAAALLGTTHTRAALEVDGLTEWLVVRTPAALPLLVAATLGARVVPSQRRADASLEALRSGVVAGLAVSLLLGGGQIGRPVLPSLALGLLLVVGLLLLARQVRVPAAFTLPTAAFAFVLAALQAHHGLSAQPVHLDGADARPLALAVLVLGAAIGCLRASRRPAPDETLHLHL